jgi:DNA-binding LacI/PurR family transcriptional regulator
MPELDDQEIRIVAALANVDYRTVRRLVQGLPPRSRATREAIVAVLRERGHKQLAARLGAA